MVCLIKNKDQLTAELANAGSKLVVIDFFATWCGPCKVIAPHIEKMAAEYTQVVFLKVDVEECEDLATEYQISSMPTFIYIKNGSQVHTISGSNAEKVEDLVIKYM